MAITDRGQLRRTLETLSEEHENDRSSGYGLANHIVQWWDELDEDGKKVLEDILLEEVSHLTYRLETALDVLQRRGSEETERALERIVRTLPDCVGRDIILK